MNQLDTTYLKASTPILHEWYSLIVDNKGNPDLVAISLYAELFAWFRNLSSFPSYYHGDHLPEIVDNKLSISYAFLCDKLNLSHERIRRAFVRLEALKLLSRSVVYTDIDDNIRNNKLFVTLESSYFASCFRDPNTDVRVSSCSSVFSNTLSFRKKPSPLFCGDYIRNKNIIINRSNESNFVKVFDKENIHADHYLSEEKIEINQNNSNFVKKASDNSTRMLIKQSRGRINNIASRSLQNWGARKEQIKFTTAKKLVSFYPLKDEEVGELQAKSGREFSKRAMNEILRDMSRKLQSAEREPTFWSKKGFIAYMAKAFKYEKRDAVKISNETFQIRANESKEEKRIRIEEEYLTELEYSLQVGPDWHFKKKLAAVLERSKAYELLTSIKTIEQTKEGKLRLILHRQVAITVLEKEIILNQAKATHERIENGEYKEIIDIELVVPAEKQYQQHQRQHHYSDMKSINQERSSAATGVAMVSGRIVGGEMQANAEEPLPDTIWGEVRKRIRDIYGYHTEKAWISRLEEETDEENKQIRLRAQSSFYKDYIETNYLDKIAQIAKEQGYSIKGQCIECA